MHACVCICLLCACTLQEEKDFDFLAENLARLLNNPLQASYLPASFKAVDLHHGSLCFRVCVCARVCVCVRARVCVLGCVFLGEYV